MDVEPVEHLEGTHEEHDVSPENSVKGDDDSPVTNHKSPPQKKKPPVADDQISEASASPDEEISPEETDEIIQSMLTILQGCQKKVDDQKIDSHSLVFMLLRIKESLDTYCGDYIPKINSFLVNAEKITAEHFAQISCSLPPYGDYCKAIEEEDSVKIDIGLTNLVEKDEVLKLVQTVTDSSYAAGTFNKSTRTIIRDINNCQPERREIVYKMAAPLPKWMEFQEKVTTQLEFIREQTFKMSAYIDFLKQRETKMVPTLDLTGLNSMCCSTSNRTQGTPKQSPEK